MTVVDLVGELRPRQSNIGSVDHHNEVPAIDMRGEGRLVLSSQDIRDLSRDPPNDA